MPRQVCAVASCKSNRLSLKKEGVNLLFHSFPKANNLCSSTIRKEWINRCKRADKFNPNTSTICCLHFTPNDYERDLQNELLGLPLRRILKKTAVPTLNLYTRQKSPEKLIEDTPRTKRAQNEKNQDLVKSLITNISLDKLESFGPLDVPNTSTDMPSTYMGISEKPSTSSIPDTYKQKYEDLLLKYNQLKSSSNKKIKGLSSMLKYYKLKCFNQSTTKSTKSVVAEKLLNMVLTQNQISFAVKEKKSCPLDT